MLSSPLPNVGHQRMFQVVSAQRCRRAGQRTLVEFRRRPISAHAFSPIMPTPAGPTRSRSQSLAALCRRRGRTSRWRENVFQPVARGTCVAGAGSPRAPGFRNLCHVRPWTMARSSICKDHKPLHHASSRQCGCRRQKLALHSPRSVAAAVWTMRRKRSAVHRLDIGCLKCFYIRKC
jgi:hypothetical protein